MELRVGMSHLQELRHFEPPLQAAAHGVSSHFPSPNTGLLWSLLITFPQAQPLLRTSALQTLLAYRALGLVQRIIQKANRNFSREALTMCSDSLRKKQEDCREEGTVELEGWVGFGYVA